MNCCQRTVNPTNPTVILGLSRRIHDECGWSGEAAGMRSRPGNVLTFDQIRLDYLLEANVM